MKVQSLVFSFLLIWCSSLICQLDQPSMSQMLHISQGLVGRILDQIARVDWVNTQHAPYYPILSQFLNERDYKIGCEIGIFTAGHSEFILANSSVERLYCIDPYCAPMHTPTVVADGFEKKYWQTCWDILYYYALDKLSRFGNRVIFFRLAADRAAENIRSDSLDFIYIDGDHSYQAVLSDCTNYYDKVRSGGLIAGDDYDLDEVGQAVRDFFNPKNLTIHVYPGQKRFWWVEKP